MRERTGSTFTTTQWSLVAAAREGEDTAAREALAVLCRTYWYPLYAYIRRQGANPDDARDLTQEFMSRLITKGFLKSVRRERGRFRSFLLAACKHFLANERDRARAQKRGGTAKHLSIDVIRAEDRYQQEPSHGLTPERLFERRWALTVLETVLDRLRKEFARTGKGLLFDNLECLLAGEKTGSYATVAERMGMTEGAIKVAVHRLRRRYREALLAEIGRTLSDGRDLNDEVRLLFQAVSQEKDGTL